MLSKKSNLFLVGLMLAGLCGQAQLTVQSGATFTMQAGAQVTVQGNVDNAGTIANEGLLKVQGNYANTGAYTAAAGVLEMYGTGNSNVNAGGSSIANLVINKAGVSDIVKLTASATVTSAFTLTNGIFTTDPITNPAFAIISPVTAAYSFAAGKEIIGTVKRTGFTSGVAHVFNQSNMLVTTNAGVTPTDVTVTMIPQSAGGDPSQAEREVTRKFSIAQTAGSGFTADVRYPYASAELNSNTETNLVPWRLAASEWNARLSPVTRDAAADYVNTTGIPADELAQEWKLADPNYIMNVTANLRGPWNSTNMNTSLNTAGIIPLSQPYNTTPFNYAGIESVGSIPADVVDWVLIEHRKPASGLPEDALLATITGRKAGFLLNNGTIVETDGVTPITVPIGKQGTAFVVVRHMNHLGVLSNPMASNAAGTFTNDFTILANAYKPLGASSDPLVLLAGAGGKYGLWAGDANRSGLVNATDVSSIKLAIANSLAGYQSTDVNLSNNINATDVALTKATISLSGSGSGTNSLTRASEKKVKTNIPDQVTED